MKQIPMDSQAPFLPRDVIANILKRLPAKSLIRFQYVCKDWKNLLKTPFFITAHLHHSSNENPFLLFTRNGWDNLMLFDLLNSKMQLSEVQSAPLIERFWYKIVGSYNGLLCFLNDDSNIFPPSFLLWNPATREVRQIPRPHIESDHHFLVGFGFSPILNDCKIVINYGTPFYHVVDRVHVYSLSTGIWKEIEFGNLEGVSCWHQTIAADGVIFWLGSKQFVKGQDGDDGPSLLVSFDIATEVFKVIPMPSLDCNSIPGLTVYENKLAFLVSIVGGNLGYYAVELWVMEDDIDATREMWNWTKKYTSSFYPCFLSPVTIWRSQVVCSVVMMPEPISETSGQEKNGEPTTVLYLFNLTTNGLTMFPMDRRFQGDDIFNYIESLVPLSNTHIEEL